MRSDDREEGKDIMDNAAKMIAVVQGAPGPTVQDIFHRLIDRWRLSARVAGVIAESHGLVDRACSAGFLRNIGTGELFPIFRDLGPGSTACHIDGASMLPAVEAAWAEFAAPLFVALPADPIEIDAWCHAVRLPIRTVDSGSVPVMSYGNRNPLM
jgi:hypothetical protein